MYCGRGMSGVVGSRWPLVARGYLVPQARITAIRKQPDKFRTLHSLKVYCKELEIDSIPPASSCRAWTEIFFSQFQWHDCLSHKALTERLNCAIQLRFPNRSVLEGLRLKRRVCWSACLVERRNKTMLGVFSFRAVAGSGSWPFF